MGNSESSAGGAHGPKAAEARNRRKMSQAAGDKPGGGRADGDNLVDSGSVDVVGHGVVINYHCKSVPGKVDGVGKTNQDAFLACKTIGRGGDVSLFGVLDGHGKFGERASDFVKVQLLEQLGYKSLSNPAKALKTAFTRAHDQLNKSMIDSSFSGTTCTVCVRVGLTFYCSCVGDSRCVVGGIKPDGEVYHKDLSIDHTPNLPGEERRIRKSGGEVKRLTDIATQQEMGPHRVWVMGEMFPGLAMSRSIGDDIAHSVGVSSKPDVVEHVINVESDQCLIVASDGVWEFISSEEAVELVCKQQSPEEAANVLCAEALKRWEAQEEVVDDITAVVLFFKTS